MCWARRSASAPRPEAAVEEYIRLFEAIESSGVDSNVSIKPTLLGLKIDEGFCRDNVERIASAAAAIGNFVRIDMEDHTCTDATLQIYCGILEEIGHVGVVLQAYLHRTVADINDLLPHTPNIRLCKGIYREPRAIAWKQYETVRANFIYAMNKLLEGGAYVGIATHDAHLVWAGMAAIDRLGLKPDRIRVPDAARGRSRAPPDHPRWRTPTSGLCPVWS